MYVHFFFVGQKDQTTNIRDRNEKRESARDIALQRLENFYILQQIYLYFYVQIVNKCALVPFQLPTHKTGFLHNLFIKKYL